MAEGAAPRVKTADAVRVHYHPPGQIMSFVEGIVSRVNVTTTRGPGFQIDITCDVFLGQEQPVRPGYEHYVLYKQLEDFPEKAEVLSQAQREPESHLEHRSEPDMTQEAEQEPEAETLPEAQQKLLPNAEQDTEEAAPKLEAETGGSQGQVERQDGQRRGGRIVSILRWRK